tara:strand:+ start:1575 stop:2360 length:786 start_codon:yes stop_codon:yes gene_type:complete
MTLQTFFKKFSWSTLVVVFGVAFFTGLGSWQLKRLSWKENLIQTVETRLQGPRLPLEEFLEKYTSFTTHEYEKLTLEGQYLHDQETYLLGRTNGGQVVYHVVTPFLLESGTVILVDRGWIPAKVSSSDPDITRPKGTLIEQGHMRLKSSRNLFTPDNNYEKGNLYSIEPKEYAREKSMTTLLPFYVVRESTNDTNSFPRARKTALPEMHNNHLQYALTWYFMAFVLIVMYLVLLKKKMHSEERSPGKSSSRPKKNKSALKK